MTTRDLPAREIQALEQVGVTAVSRPVAVIATLVFVITISGVALFERSVDSAVCRDFGAQMGASLARFDDEGLFAANRALLAAMDEFERRLEEESFLHRWLLPELQWRLAALSGLGNEKVYIGRSEWLFFRPDVDHVIGPGFLDPRVQLARRRGGEAWQPAPEPDPMPALLEFHHQLESRGIHLIVVPTPVKPTVEAGRLSRRAEKAESALQNPSFAAFIDSLIEAGIEVVDLAPQLFDRQRETGRAQYLRTDTHWTPDAVDYAAGNLAKRVQTALSLTAPGDEPYRRRPIELTGLGDIADMLLLPAGSRWIEAERVEAFMVTRLDGRTWRPQRDAEVLLLGDSFANVFSDPSLGWGTGAGLGEQLSYHLQRPIDKLAVNAGGAFQTRRILQRALAGGEDRLAGKKLVIYQFATRELSQGDWQVLPLTPNR